MVLKYAEIGRRIAAARVARYGRRSGRSTARLLGITGEALRLIEAGSSKPNNERLMEIAHLVGLRLVVHLIDPNDKRAALWLRSMRFFAEADDSLFNGISAMIDAWERDNLPADELGTGTRG